MSDQTVRDALRSDLRLVVVEAPAGCGKTHQGADYAREIAQAATDRVLILTHTHAACSMFAERTKGTGHRLEIRTIDSVIGQIAAAYHKSLGIPADPSLWVRREKDGHDKLAIKVTGLLKNHPMITASLARRYPVVICDEHQDSSGDQHGLVMALLEQGCKLRIFADPMQEIFKGKPVEGASRPYKWGELTGAAHSFEALDTPHRWRDGCPQLGAWTLRVREILKAGGKVSLRNGIPPSVEIVVAENIAQRNFDYQLAHNHRREINTFEGQHGSLMVLTRYNATARSFRGFFNRRIPLWEGHTRTGLETLVDTIGAANGDRGKLAESVVTFMSEVGKGFSPSAFGDRFAQEARSGCTKSATGKPASLQRLARHIVEEPDHRGVSKTLRRLHEFRQNDAAFGEIEIDCHKEFWDAISLGEFLDIEDGLAEITRRRTYTRPKPAEKSISIIHKAKGLECGTVIVMPCDAMTFKDTREGRCLFYVAVSRAKHRLMLVVSRDKPCPLLEF